MATVQVTPSEATVQYEDTVTITATVSPESEGGLPVEWKIYNVTWQADPAEVSHPKSGLSPCGSGSFLPSGTASKTCRGVVWVSGTLQVFAIANGDTVPPRTVQITVPRPKLYITPDPATIQEGQSATFTAKLTGPAKEFNIIGWSWYHNGVGGGLCGGSVTCQTGVASLVHSGTRVIVNATVNGRTQTDTTTMYVIPCLTGDTLADNYEVRQALIAQQDSSETESRERGGSVVRNTSTGKDSVIFHPGLVMSDCQVKWPFPSLPQLPPGYIRVAIWHTHWKTPGTSCTDPDFDPTFKASHGVSPADWWAAKRFNCAHYVIDEDHLHKVNPWNKPKTEVKKWPERWVERSPSTTKCRTWPAFNDEDSALDQPYNC